MHPDDEKIIRHCAQQAYELGASHARNAASWAADGNTTQEHIARVLDMLDAGDPQAWDFLPREPNLSGEYADDPTPLSLARDITGVDDPTAELIDACADAYMEGVLDTFGPACEEELSRWVDR